MSENFRSMPFHDISRSAEKGINGHDDFSHAYEVVLGNSNRSPIKENEGERISKSPRLDLQKLHNYNLAPMSHRDIEDKENNNKFTDGSQSSSKKDKSNEKSLSNRKKKRVHTEMKETNFSPSKHFGLAQESATRELLQNLSENNKSTSGNLQAEISQLNPDQELKLLQIVKLLKQ